MSRSSCRLFGSLVVAGGIAPPQNIHRGKMLAFEYLRIVQRESGLDYIAQPGGKTATEFVLTELIESRAVFDSPRHDYPKRIVFELSAEGISSATVGVLKGGMPRRYDFERK